MMMFVVFIQHTLGIILIFYGRLVVVLFIYGYHPGPNVDMRVHVDSITTGITANSVVNLIPLRLLNVVCPNYRINGDIKCVDFIDG